MPIFKFPRVYFIFTEKFLTSYIPECAGFRLEQHSSFKPLYIKSIQSLVFITKFQDFDTPVSMSLR